MTLAEMLLRDATAVLESSHIAFSTSSELPDYCRFDIPATLPNGFDVSLEAESSAVTVYWGNCHTRFEKTKSIDLLVDGVLGLVRDMLSPKMRILELRAGGRPYKGMLQCFRNESWSTEQSMTLVFLY